VSQKVVSDRWFEKSLRELGLKVNKIEWKFVLQVRFKRHSN
jgi:hypothetical protein